MPKLKELKTQFGDKYCFERYMTEKEICRLQSRDSAKMLEQLICRLIIGCMKIEAAIYCSDGKVVMGYEVFVKDDPERDEWICYDSPPDSVCIQDRRMEQAAFNVLDKIVTEGGFSYSKCIFKRMQGKINEKLK
jgi:hypothetical protein